MVAASKLRRSQERVIAARPYAATLGATLASVAGARPAREDGSPSHPLLAPARGEEGRPRRRDRRQGPLRRLQHEREPGGGAFLAREGEGRLEVSLVTLGRKAIDFWKRRTRARPRGAARPLPALRLRDRRRDRPRRSAALHRGRDRRRLRRLQRVQERHRARSSSVKRLLPIELGELGRGRRGRLPLRAGPGRHPRTARPAAPRVPALPAPPRVERGRERGPDDGDGGRDEERGRDDRLAHPHLQPRAPGEDHQGAHRDRLRRRRPR